MSDDTAVIDPTPTQFTINGREIEIRPLKVGQLGAFARAIKPLGSTIQGIAEGAQGLDAGTMLAIVADHTDAVVLACSIATSAKVEELNEQTPDVLVELVIKVLQVNADFFKGRLTPAILGAVKKALPQSLGAGPTQ